MRYPYLDQKSAGEIIEKRIKGEEPIVEDFLKWRGEGPEFNRGAMKSLRVKLDDLIKKYSGTGQKGKKFEAEACTIIHQSIEGDISIFGDLDFWVYLAVIEFPDLISWRYSVGEDQNISLANYGIGNRVENLIYRLWIRADIAYDTDLKDHYGLARKGDIDVWRSHILRQRYGNCRNIACALIKYQYPEDAKGSRLSVKVLRELAKRLKRLYTNLEFSFLNEDQAMELIEREANTALMVFRGA